METPLITHSGWSFPPAFGAGGGELRGTTGAASIKQALEVLFATKIGERLNHPTYGCDLDRYLFEQVSMQVTIDIENSVLDAIKIHEPRVKNPQVSVSDIIDNGQQLQIKVTYSLGDTGQQDSLIVPLDLLGDGAGYGF